MTTTTHIENGDVIEASYLPTVRETYYPEQTALVPQVGGAGSHISAPNQPIAIPEWLAGYEPDWAELDKKTPKDYIRSVTNNAGVIMYRYVTTNFIIRKLNKVFKHQWRCEIIREGWGQVKEDGKEYVVIAQLVWPGSFRPIIGVGSSLFMPSNKQDTEAKTRAGAYTAALKNAAKQLGIGRDIEEDDPEVAKVVEDRVRTISNMYDRLVTRGQEEAARNVVRKVAPTALMDNGALLMSAVEFENLEPLQRELSALVVKTAQKKGAEPVEAT